jgi:hypothetical protein
MVFIKYKHHMITFSSLIRIMCTCIKKSRNYWPNGEVHSDRPYMGGINQPAIDNLRNGLKEEIPGILSGLVGKVPRQGEVPH